MDMKSASHDLMLLDVDAALVVLRMTFIAGGLVLGRGANEP
jgi:hypothetical protein